MAYTKNEQNKDYGNLNYYLTVNVNNICRVCLEKGSKLMPIFDPVKPPHFSILIMACASVQVVEGDGLPPYICQKCVSKLNVAFQFKTQCENSDVKLRQCFENFNNLPPPPDLCGFLDLKKDSELTATYSQNGQAMDQVIETHQEQISNGEVSSTSTSLDDHLETIDTSQLHQVTTLQEIDKNSLTELKIEFGDFKAVDMNLKVDSLSLNETENKPIVKRHQCGTCGKAFKTKPSLIHHIRIHTGERPYLCHLCDKRFVNGGHLHTHMRTHTGEKNHICAACSKAFATAQQLTKHTIAIHTSERPYACNYCSKRFASSSNLNTHIKVHTGEKNYRCEQCGKAFATKGQLYQHILVHTGEKAFLCEYCHKRFSQKAHLIRHLKIHTSS